MEQIRHQFLWDEEAGFGIDTSRIFETADGLASRSARFKSAIQVMEELENGAIANVDENRCVGHYWLRAPELAPAEEIRQQIVGTFDRLLRFVQAIHLGEIGTNSGPFQQVLCIGIGGSALGPQFLVDALQKPGAGLPIFFIDNTDPDGFRRIWSQLLPKLDQTLIVVTSKSGSTPEPRNALLETENFFAKNGLDFASHAVAITCEGSLLDNQAKEAGWLASFPLWDWVGGRTSITSVVGLLPAALAKVNVREFLQGARKMDEWTRCRDGLKNPALILADSWFRATNGRGERVMILLPYCDSLRLLGSYLQQLIMESLGKSQTLQGEEVKQGIYVFGNKGSTDQHSYIQQLRDGLDNFFVTFIEVLRADSFNEQTPVEEDDVTSSDFLEGFLLGTRQALTENGRQSLTLTLRNVSPFSLGMLVALYERAVGFYAHWININAYSQPGVEAGKKAAKTIIELRMKIRKYLDENGLDPDSAVSLEVAKAIGDARQEENVFKILEFLRANDRK